MNVCNNVAGKWYTSGVMRESPKTGVCHVMRRRSRITFFSFNNNNNIIKF